MVRVYSRALERQVYPVPRRMLQNDDHERGYTLLANSPISGISLHRRIRELDKPYSVEIRRLDDLFASSTHPENISDVQLDEYERLIEKASKEELKSCDVILCTCIGSASRRVVAELNVEQIIIDECGMCTEPTCLVPLVCYPSASQVAIVGDHKQLQPIVVNYVARRFGLGKSLFERYVSQAIMLTTQYRMVCTARGAADAKLCIDKCFI